MLKDTNDKNYYEVLWYNGTSEEDALQKGNYESKSFRSSKAAMNCYNKHKNDSNKFGWWVTYRDADGCVLDDLVI